MGSLLSFCAPEGEEQCHNEMRQAVRENLRHLRLVLSVLCFWLVQLEKGKTCS